jgi:PKD repeat protein
VFHNSVLLVGTTPGASDVGRVRIRSIDASRLTVAQNFDIPWEFGLYVTAINYVDLNPIYPSVSGSSIVDLQFWKDYDVVYTDQNSILGSFPIAGSHQAAFISGSSASIYWDASGTYHVNGDTLTYAWVFEGGSPGTSSVKTPGYVSYSTPGHYRTTLTVTSSGGSVDITHRFVSIYPRAANGDAIPPIQRWSFSSLQGSRSEGGYSVALKVYDQIDKIYDGALVVIFADQTTYGNTKATIGSPIKFVGYIEKGTIVYDYETSSVEFTAVSATAMLKNIEAFSISLNSVASPAYWYEIQNMTITKILYHYLRWHTTVLDCTDFQYTGDDRNKHYWDSNRDSIYNAISSFIQSGVLGEVGCDRLGRIWAEIIPGAVHEAALNLPVTMSINKQDWMGEPSIEENITKQYSSLELGGVVFDGSNIDTAILGIAPGFAPGVRGKINSIEGFIATSQEQLNDAAGDYWAYLTARYGVTLKMAGNYNNLDIFPASQCLLNISGSDTNRGITFLDSPFHPTQMDWTYDAQHGFIYPQVKFAQIPNGMQGFTEAIAAAQTVPIPTVPPVIVIPPLPAFPWPAFNFGFKTYTWVIAAPSAGGIPGPYIPVPLSAVGVYAYCIGGTSVSFNIEDRSVIGAPGTDIMPMDLSAYTTGASFVGGFSSPKLAAGHWLWVDISGISGTPTKLCITLQVLSI